jgi:hypothetical protein
LEARSEVRGVGRSIWRRVLWVLITGVVAISLLSSVLFLLINSSFVQKELINEVVRRVYAECGSEVMFGSFEWHPLSSLRLSDLLVRSSGKDVLKCKNVELTYRLGWENPFLFPDELLLDKPYIHLEKEKDGSIAFFNRRTGETGRGGAIGSEPVWARYALPRVRIASGVIEAEQDGRRVLYVGNVNATFDLKVVRGPDGPRLRIDLGELQSLLDRRF